MVAAIQKQDSGMATRNVCRAFGISEATYYNRKAKYGGRQVSDVKRLKDSEAELSQTKKIVAELTFENRAAKGLIEKKFQCLLKRMRPFIAFFEKSRAVSARRVRPCNGHVVYFNTRVNPKTTA